MPWFVLAVLTLEARYIVGRCAVATLFEHRQDSRDGVDGDWKDRYRRAKPFPVKALPGMQQRVPRR